ncbi:hypothetical protein D3C81_2056320 [compost metagenome]
MCRADHDEILLVFTVFEIPFNLVGHTDIAVNQHCLVVFRVSGKAVGQLQQLLIIA